MIRGTSEIRDAYRNDTVAETYVDNRFREPLGAPLHDRQVGHLVRLFQQLKPQRVLEIAPGPARLTVDVARYLPTPPVLIDASAQMLATARRRLGAAPTSSSLVQGDAFRLPFGPVFDCVYTFRLIRHFEAEDRRRLYAEIARVLRPGGTLVFDAINEDVSAPLRRHTAADEHQHYDALFKRDSLVAELTAAGFNVKHLEGVQRRYSLLRNLQILVAPRSRVLARSAMEIVDRVGQGSPLEWIVDCCRA